MKNKKELFDCDFLFLRSVIVSNIAKNIEINSKYSHILLKKYHRVECPPSKISIRHETIRKSPLLITEHRTHKTY